MLGYVNYRHFEAVIEKVKTACFNSGQRVEDHFVGSDQMIEIGKGGQRAVKSVMMSRYACCLAIQSQVILHPCEDERTKLDVRLEEGSAGRLFWTTAADGKPYEVAHYNLDMVLALGFRVRSQWNMPTIASI